MLAEDGFELLQYVVAESEKLLVNRKRHGQSLVGNAD
jgi:hypothetical protein